MEATTDKSLMTGRENDAMSLVSAISEATGVSVENILGEDRRKEFVQTRFACYVVLRDQLGFSYPELARFMRRRAHKSIQNGCSAVRDWMDTDRYFREWWDRYVAPAVDRQAIVRGRKTGGNICKM